MLLPNRYRRELRLQELDLLRDWRQIMEPAAIGAPEGALSSALQELLRRFDSPVEDNDDSSVAGE